MTIEVFWGSGSPYAWSVLLALEVKHIPYESRLLSFSAGEHKTPEFLEMNPRGKVPVIRDGDYTLGESMAILAYLERRHPDPPLFGRTPEETGRIWKAVSDDVCYTQPASHKIITPVLFGDVGTDAQAMSDGAREVECELARIVTDLDHHPWLAGETVTAADVVTYPTLALLFRVGSREAVKALGVGFDGWRERWPVIAAWFARVESLPGYERTYPPHWRES
jgi:glutathione S-transferase